MAIYDCFEPVPSRNPESVERLSQKAKMEIGLLKELHQELSRDIEFLAARSAIYYNAHRTEGPVLKRGDLVAET